MATPKKTPKAEVSPVERDFTHLRVRSVAKSFRRAGRTFTQADTVIAADELSDDEIRALQAERELVVEKIAQKEPGNDAK